MKFILFIIIKIKSIHGEEGHFCTKYQVGTMILTASAEELLEFRHIDVSIHASILIFLTAIVHKAHMDS